MSDVDEELWASPRGEKADIEIVSSYIHYDRTKSYAIGQIYGGREREKERKKERNKERKKERRML